MRISDMLGICWKNLTRRKLRTVLTALGVVIGVCAILVMISIGIGLEQYFDSMLEGMGDLTLIEVMAWGGKEDVTLDDKTIASFKTLKGVQGVTPFWQVYDMEFNMRTEDERYNTRRPKTNDEKYQDRSRINIIGVYADALEDMGYSIDKGHMFAENDKPFTVVVGSGFSYRFIDTKRRPGKGDRREPWPKEDGTIDEPFFDILKQKMVMYQALPKKDEEKDPDKFFEITPIIKGVLKEKENDWELRNAVIMDINDLKLLMEKYNKMAGVKRKVEIKFDNVRVKCNTIEDVLPVQKEIEKMGFYCNSMESMRESMQEQSRMIQMVLGGLAAISLFVAAIGIANTMVMSIIERTKEIGIMKVIGAELKNIRTMFLIEAGMIGFLGGLIGVVFSYIISFAINYFMAEGMGRQISVIPLWLVGFALLFSILIGVIFGFLPANRAVKISALEAIKHD